MSFIAKFQQVEQGAKGFKADKNQEMPFIGTVLAGTSRGTIYNGTMFKREGLVAGKLYLCENTIGENPEYPDAITTNIVTEVSALDFISLRKELGAPQLKRVSAAVEAEKEIA